MSAGSAGTALGPRCPRLHFDHHAPNERAALERLCADLRRDGGIAWSDAYDGFWVVGGFDLVDEVLRNPALFFSGRRDGGRSAGLGIPTFRTPAFIPGEVDPPDHRPYRDLLLPFLGKSAMAGLAPVVAEIVDGLLEDIARKRAFDVVSDLGNAVPGIVTMHLLGLPYEAWGRIVRPVHDTHNVEPGSAAAAEVQRQMDAVLGELTDLIARRRREPADDLTSHLVRASEPHALDDHEVLSLQLAVLFGGVGTTAEAIANSLLYLQHDAALRARLAEGPHAADIVEELLRYITPAQSSARTVARDTELGGQRLHGGQRILLLLLGSANRDAQRFDRPDAVLPDRERRRHVVFGGGVHTCTGQWLARLELTTTLRAFVRRFPDYRIDENAAVPFAVQSIHAGWLGMPAVVEAS
ncbi:cytochrome P450 [Amycolatopsis thermophila]|uniref:Cytochrome P450 n=1 Tax=Amycolatopsis thermophila TaxID=206084 RepID=A0ABU0F5L1_9PSEU|nr:cytochrome P450 [Amycolatopsis thermophila]MDQ0382812.1 cytochrome P450 [Amycolatopsis thermophila]